MQETKTKLNVCLCRAYFMLTMILDEDGMGISSCDAKWRCPKNDSNMNFASWRPIFGITTE